MKKIHSLSISKKFLSILLVTLVFLLPISFGLFLMFKQEAKAAWFNDLWLYRQEISITGNGSNLTNYQIQLVGIDTQDLYTNGKIQSNCEDIRFTDLNGKLLDYWIEDNGTDCDVDSSTDIWVKVENLYSSGTKLLMYYGNKNAPEDSSGSKTFEFFEDFTTSVVNPNRWTKNGTINITGGDLILDNSEGLKSVDSFSTNTKLIALVSQSSNSLNLARVGYSNVNLGSSYTSDDSTSFLFDATTGGNFERENTNEGASTTNSGSTTETTSAIDIEIGRTAGSVTFNLNNAIDGSTITSNVPDENMSIRIENSSVSDTLTIGYIAIANYSTDNPTNQSFGTEERGEGPFVYIPFDESSGATTYDMTSNNIDGTLNGNVSFSQRSDCYKNNCVNFDGSGDYISLPIDIDNYPELTLSAWVYATASTNEFELVFGNDDGAYDRGLSAGEQDTGANWTVFVGNNQVETGINVSYGYWEHVTLVYSSSDVTLYINGNKVWNNGSQASGYSGSSTLKIGRSDYSGGSSYFGGRVDEFRLYEFALDQKQVNNIYSAYGHVIGLGDSGVSAVANWHFDETSGTVAYDSSINQLNGTLFGSMTDSDWVAGKFDRGLDFDGINDYVSVSDNVLLDFTSQLSISAWVNPRTLGDWRIIALKVSDGSWGDGYGIYYLGGSICGFVRNYDTYKVCTAFNITNKFSHIELTYDGTNLIIYINGVATAKSSPGVTISTNNGALTFGSGDGGYYWDGVLDEYKVYNYARTGEQVREDFLSTVVNQSVKDEYQNDLLEDPNLEGYWNFDEGSGGTLYDQSVHGRNGTINGGAVWLPKGFDNKGSALSFDGSNDYVGLPGWYIGNNFTLSAWFNPRNSFDSGSIICKSSDSNFGYILGIITGWGGDAAPIEFSYASSSNFHQPTVALGSKGIELNSWNQLTAVKDGTDTYLYINGELVSRTGGRVNTVHNNSAALNFALCFNDYLSGNIDEVKIFSRALSPSEIKRDFTLSFSNVLAVNEINQDFEPVLFAKMDEKTGTLTSNFTSRVPWASDLNNMDSSTDWVRGKYGSALDFDGVDDYLAFYNADITDGGMTMTGKSAYIVSAWIKPRSDGESNAGQIWYKSSSSYLSTTNESGGNVKISGSIQLSSSDATVTSTGTIPLNAWSHIALRYVDDSDDEIEIYINGSLDSISTNGSGSLPTESNYTIIGGSSSNNYDGVIDNVKVWSQNLSAREIALDYNGGLPLGLWSLDDGEGMTAKDNSEISTPGNLTNIETTDWQNTNCKKNGCLTFDGTNEYIDVPETSELNFIGSSFSITAYAKFNSSNASQYILEKKNSSAKQYYLEYVYNSDPCSLGTGNYIVVGYHDGSNYRNYCYSFTPQTGRWYHIAGTNDGTNVKIYIDGSEVSTGAAVGSLNPGSGNLRIGSSADVSPNGFFNGTLDEVKLFSYGLNAGDVKRDVNFGSTLRYE